MDKDNLPDTIKYPEAFDKSKPANFDGVMNWDWINNAFSDTKIQATDFDAVVERNSHYLVIESKGLNVKVKDGQRMALERLSQAKTFTIIYTQGKQSPPDKIEVHFPNGKIRHYEGRRATEIIKFWRRAAENDTLGKMFKACEICHIYKAETEYKGKSICTLCRDAEKGWLEPVLK